MDSRANPPPATRQSWACSPMPAQCARLPFRRELSARELDVLRRGLVPRRMEEKWFVFVEGDTLHAHRSWTGVCIFQVSFSRAGEGYVADDALVNRDAREYGGTDVAQDARLLASLIDELLVGGRPMRAEASRTAAPRRPSPWLRAWGELSWLAAVARAGWAAALDRRRRRRDGHREE